MMKKKSSNKSKKTETYEYDLEKEEQELDNWLKQQAKDGSQRGGGKKTCIDTTKLGKEVQWFNPQVGKKNKIDIIPFVIKEGWFQELKEQTGNVTNKKTGKLAPSLIIPVHRGLGANKKTVLCLQAAFDKRCPVCEERFRLSQEGYEKNKEAIKLLKVSWRGFYNVIDRLDKKKGMQLWEISCFCFEDTLREEASTSDKGSIPYAKVTSGYSIAFKVKEQHIGSNSFVIIPTLDFVERKEQYTKDILKEVYQLDESLIIPTYDEVKSLLYELDTEETEEDDFPEIGRVDSDKDEDEEDEEDEDEDEEIIEDESDEDESDEDEEEDDDEEDRE